MISPSLPTFTHSHSVLGKPHTKDENFQHEDPVSQLKRCRGTLPYRRVHLDPLSVSDLENRRNRLLQSTDASCAIPSSISELLSSGYGMAQPRGSCSAPVSSWPPPIPASNTSSNSGLAGQRPSQCVNPHSSDKTPSESRGTFLESTSSWHVPDFLQTEPTTTMTKPIRTTGWKSENVLQPIRSRISSVPTVRRPPGELWQSDTCPTKAIYEPIDSADLSVCLTPPGLPSRRPELRRSGPNSDILSLRLISSSLALGSQPLTAPEHTKTVPPIGAERNQAVFPTSLKPHTPATHTGDALQSSWYSSALQAKWKNDVYLLDTTSLEKVQAAAGYTGTSREDLERLLHHAVRNKHAPKIISPLSPLRTSTAAFDLSTDPEYQLRMPSHSNSPSPRYSKYLPKRVRTVCDGHQSSDLNITCTHCQECKRDTIGKRLLALHYRQHLSQRNKLLAFPSASDDRIALANRIREAFAYEVDDEEKSLWEEVAAITGAGPQPFSRVGAPCAAAHRFAADDRSEDGVHDDHLEISDESLLANESATLFRDVTVY